VTIVDGDGRALPFSDAGFDLAWTQAVWQSVEDKAALSAEIHRVLRPGGRLALLEVIGDGQELHYPVPWADGPAASFVLTGDRLASLLQDAGFLVESWRAGEHAQTAIVAAAADAERMAPRLSSVGLGLVMPAYQARMAGLAGNVEAGRISLLLAVMTKLNREPAGPLARATGRATVRRRLVSGSCRR
jgi:MPBQ/MSBQ methyltransferase